MLAADTLCSYGSMAKFMGARRLVEVDKVLLGAGGELSDFQSIQDQLEAHALSEECTSGLYDKHRSNAREIWNYLGAFMYKRRNDMNPIWNDVVVAGKDSSGKMFLGSVDKIGTKLEEDILATGFGSYFVISLLREKWRNDMQEGEARALLEDCMRILFYRDGRASNRIQIAKVSQDSGDVLISDPYELETQWDIGTLTTPVTDLDGDGGW